MKRMLMGILVLMPYFLSAVITQVYNLRITETTKRNAFEEKHAGPWLISETVDNVFRKKYDGLKHYLTAGMTTITYSKKQYFGRVDFAVGKVASSDCGVYFSKVQTDDLLFTAGYSPINTPTSEISMAGLFGIPLHKDLSLLRVQFGYAHVGLGGQLDGSFLLKKDEKYTHSLRVAARAIHFFKRKVPALTDKGCCFFNFVPGNLIDLFAAYHLHFDTNRLEVGYDLTVLMGSNIHPFLVGITHAINYVRHDFYASFKHRFLLRDVHNAITVAMSTGFDQEPKVVGNARLLNIWGIWEINF